MLFGDMLIYPSSLTSITNAAEAPFGRWTRGTVRRMIHPDHPGGDPEFLNLMGAIFVAGAVFEAALLLGSIAFGWKVGPYAPTPGAVAALGRGAAAAGAAAPGLETAL